MSKPIPSRVLIIEDDPAISAVVKYYLNKEGYIASSVPDGTNALEVIRKHRPDLLILDWVLPGEQGINILAAIRKDSEFKELPVIMISSKIEDLDKISGLYNGADDYVVKPFAPVELSARIHALFRRIRPSFKGQVLSFDDIEMNLASYEVRRNGKLLKLAPIEFQILQILMERPGFVLSREDMIEKIWGPDVDVGFRTIDVHITRLRSILMSASVSKEDVIKTIRMRGYVLRLNEISEDKNSNTTAKKQS